MEPKTRTWQEYLREGLKSPIVVFALGFAALAAIGAPFFALSDVIK